MKPKNPIFKKDDRIVCITPIGDLKQGDVYTVTKCETDDEPLVGLKGHINVYYSWRFKLYEESSDLISQIQKAQSLVGKRLYTKAGVVFTPDTFRVINKYCDPGWGEPSDLNEDGFAVYLENENNFVNVVNAKRVPNSIKLTDSYDAVIEKGVVKVGCQTIPIDTVRRIIELHDQL